MKQFKNQVAFPELLGQRVCACKGSTSFKYGTAEWREFEKGILEVAQLIDEADIKFALPPAENGEYKILVGEEDADSAMAICLKCMRLEKEEKNKSKVNKLKI